MPVSLESYLIVEANPHAQVELDKLSDLLEEYGLAYFISNGPNVRPDGSVNVVLTEKPEPSFFAGMSELFEVSAENISCDAESIYEWGENWVEFTISFPLFPSESALVLDRQEQK